MQVLYKLPLVLDPQPEGGYTVTCPILPELITEGDTVQEVFANVSNALTAIIEAYEDLGRPLPSALTRFTADMPISAETLVPGGIVRQLGLEWKAFEAA